ncbi:hypothetical protein O3Q52_20125 [Streptomyces sp. ActVer]|uniref:hypothetical protein n=1 Tax=Streptomyces sp. ActVer TaxID=3014558 RepID=UPI0022B3400C|nr:hypothetical protein [Streptomyces sp. ActVer]MCZ4510455.1 hypothetical protein [Streptomyces sp. ActVer]
MAEHDITEQDRNRWQRLAHDEVGVFLSDARSLGLPAVTWIIATTGAITGKVNALGSTPAKQRADFDAWVAYLGVTPSGRTRRDGSVTLHAKFERGDLVGGAIRADIDPPMDDGGGAP